jgi:hypothetical protein
MAYLIIYLHFTGKIDFSKKEEKPRYQRGFLTYQFHTYHHVPHLLRNPVTSRISLTHQNSLLLSCTALRSYEFPLKKSIETKHASDTAFFAVQEA